MKLTPPVFEDFYDSEDPRGPSTSEHNEWRAALEEFKKNPKGSVKVKKRDNPKSNKIHE
jgi:hypothetical protein